MVPPLSDHDVAALAATVAAEPLGEHELTELANRTRGNPHFVRECARLPAVARRGGIAPPAVRGVLAHASTVLPSR